MTDASIIKKFKVAPAEGYSALLDGYTPVILRMIRRFLSDPDEVMETYTSICERLRQNNFQALRRFRINSDLTPWLSVVVANACRDRFRKQKVTSIPKSVISKLNKRERLIFKYYYQSRVLQSDIPQTVEGKHGMPCTAIDVGRAIERIDKMLSVNKRWHLLAALRANRPVMSLNDSDENGSPLIEQLMAESDEPDSFSEERISRLTNAIELLDPEDQLLIQLRFEHEMRAHQIAKVMQFENHRYVYTRLRTIVNQLRRELLLDEMEH